MIDFRGKRVTVVGLARSGAGAATLLHGLGADVTVTDRKGPEELGDVLGRLPRGIRREMGGHPPALFETADLIVVSPGVPLTIAPLQKAADKGIPIIGELELAYRVMTDRDAGMEFLAVTGTNGKSTTTMLLYEMVKESGFPALLGGNIGTALTDEMIRTGAEKAGKERQGRSAVVVELSSFQLETIQTFRPRGAALLNVTPDHMDRYPSLSAYTDAKCRVFLNQRGDDFAVLNADDAVTPDVLSRMDRAGLGAQKGPERYFFSRKGAVKGAFYEDGIIRFDLPLRCAAQLPSGFTLDPTTFVIKGVHNIENAMAASLTALLFGCSGKAVTDVLQRFPGLEHRLEFVREVGGVTYINDSKGTNVGAVVKSLESFDRPVILIAGGRDKDGDFPVLGPLVKERVKALILIGEAAGKIEKAVGDDTATHREGTLVSAVRKARDLAVSGDVVLLSPACASFDMFRDFEDRGRQFKEAVLAL